MRSPQPAATSAIVRSARGRRPPIGGLVGQPRLARAVEAKVGAAGGDEGGAGLELVAKGGLADVQRRHAIQARRQRAGEAGRHVLDDQRALAQAGGQRGEQLGERARAAGGGGDDDRARGAGDGHRAAGRGCGVAVDGVAVADERSRGRLGDGLAQALGEVLGEGVEGLADRGLGHEVEGALGQRVDRAGAVGGREGADDDDRHVGRAVLLEGAQHAEAVEAGHGEVEGHGVGPRGAALRERLVAVAGGAHHLEAGSSQAHRRGRCA